MKISKTKLRKFIREEIKRLKEDKYTKPELNKKIRYKTASGEDREGVVGDLLKGPKDSPGRKAAEKEIGNGGSDRQDKKAEKPNMFKDDPNFQNEPTPEKKPADVGQELKDTAANIKSKDIPFSVVGNNDKTKFKVKWMQDGMNFEEVVDSKEELLKVMKIIDS